MRMAPWEKEMLAMMAAANQDKAIILPLRSGDAKPLYSVSKVPEIIAKQKRQENQG